MRARRSRMASRLRETLLSGRCTENRESNKSSASFCLRDTMTRLKIAFCRVADRSNLTFLAQRHKHEILQKPSELSAGSVVAGSPNKRGFPMLLREHPLVSRHGVCNWPPVWAWTSGLENKRPRGEVGILKAVSLTKLNPPTGAIYTSITKGHHILAVCCLMTQPSAVK